MAASLLCQLGLLLNWRRPDLELAVSLVVVGVLSGVFLAMLLAMVYLYLQARRAQAKEALQHSQPNRRVSWGKVRVPRRSVPALAQAEVAMVPVTANPVHLNRHKPRRVSRVRLALRQRGGRTSVRVGGRGGGKRGGRGSGGNTAAAAATPPSVAE